jgi:hypothetical protein
MGCVSAVDDKSPLSLYGDQSLTVGDRRAEANSLCA